VILSPPTVHYQAMSSSRSSWQEKVLCRYFMVGACQKGASCPYSHDKNISNKGTLPCRFYQAGTCANGTNCRFSHGEPDPVQQLSIQMDSFAFDQSEAGSEGSYDTSLGSFEDSNYNVLVEAPGYLDPAAPTFYSASPYWEPGLVTILPTTTQQYCDHTLETNNNTQDAPPPTTASDTRPDHDPPQLVPLPGPGPWRPPNDWAEAAEFVPGVEKPRSWAQVVNTGVTYPGMEMTSSQAESLICPYFKVGECRYGDSCAYVHGEMCDYCGNNSLHPTHLDQRRLHLADCLQEHENNMELSFAVARSREKTCGICMEVVLDKPKGEARFGILPSCNHCFCLSCIRKWRSAKQFEHKIIRACPECRQTSDYICPSRFWVESREEKDRLLSDYKRNLGQKECKYFNKGSGECPFGNKCFYQHADKDGRLVDIGPPKKPVRRTNADGNLSLVQRLLLYDFLEERDGQLVLPLDFVELLDLYSDTDELSDEEEAAAI